VGFHSFFFNYIFPSFPVKAIGEGILFTSMNTLLTHYRPAMPFGNRKKNILEDLFSSALSQFRKYRPSGNLKFNISLFRHFPKLKIAQFNGKNPFNFS